MSFEADVRALANDPDAEWPVATMCLRYRRSAGRAYGGSLRISLYPGDATAKERPRFDFDTDPSIRIDDDVAQRAECEVYGHLEPGRAVLVIVGRHRLLSLTPLRPPLLGKRFGADDET